MKKYELVTNDTKTVNRKTLYRIRAIRDFGDVKVGDLGGYIEKEDNLSHNDNAWIYDNACVYDNARVYGNAWVGGNALVYDNARVYDNACVSGNARVYSNAWISDNAQIRDDAIITKAEDYATTAGFGSANRTTTFFRLKNRDIGVACGCFHGTLNEFREKVKKTHGDTKFAKEYLALAYAMELHFQ